MEKSWAEFRSDTERLATLIRESSFRPSLLIALSRGGFVPARLLSTFLQVKRITAIGIAYTGPDRATLEVFSMPTPLKTDDAVLLIEDCLESGKSLASAKTIIEPHVQAVRTCSVYKLLRTQTPVDYVVDALQEPPVFPWE